MKVRGECRWLESPQLVLQERVVWAAGTMWANTIRTVSEPLLTQRLAVDCHRKDSCAISSSLRCLSMNTNFISRSCSPIIVTSLLPPTMLNLIRTTEDLKQQRPLGIISVSLKLCHLLVLLTLAFPFTQSIGLVSFLLCGTIYEIIGLICLLCFHIF